MITADPLLEEKNEETKTQFELLSFISANLTKTEKIMNQTILGLTQVQLEKSTVELKLAEKDR